MANPFFSGRIPQDLLDRVEQHVKETGQSKTDILIQALATYLNHPLIRPSSDVALPKGEERFKAMDERLTALELSFKRLSLENTVIKPDNEKELHLQDNSIENVDIGGEKISNAKSNEVLTVNINDNILDNNVDNNQDEPKKILEAIDDLLDNKNNNLEEIISPIENLLLEAKLSSFENLATPELIAATGLSRNQIDSYKKKIKAKYKELQSSLEDNKLIESPEKIETAKPIMIHGYPYDLFYLGQNEKGNNLWSALPYDNARYQQLSI